MILAITVTIDNVPMIHRVMMKVNDGDDSHCDPGLFFRIFFIDDENYDNDDKRDNYLAYTQYIL